MKYEFVKDFQKFESKKNKIDKNQVISHPDSLPKETPKGKEQLQGGVDIKSFEPEFKSNFNSTTADDDISDKDAENLIKVHKHMLTFESFSQDFCGCCERCNCSKNTTECYCHCDNCICQNCDVNSIGESNEIIDDESESEPWYEPEWCEDCSSECEENGIEYEPNFTWTGDSWICDHCRRGV